MNSIGEDEGEECTPHHTSDVRRNSPPPENAHQATPPERRKRAIQPALSHTSQNSSTGNRIVLPVNQQSGESMDAPTNPNDTNLNDTNVLKWKCGE